MLAGSNSIYSDYSNVKLKYGHVSFTTEKGNATDHWLHSKNTCLEKSSHSRWESKREHETFKLGVEKLNT